MTGLTDACMEDLSAALRATRTLRNLGLSNNTLTDASAAALVQAVQQSQSMQEMKYVCSSWVNYKPPSSQNKHAKPAANPASPSLHSFSIKYNDFSEDVFEVFDTCDKIRY